MYGVWLCHQVLPEFDAKTSQFKQLLLRARSFPRDVLSAAPAGRVLAVRNKEMGNAIWLTFCTGFGVFLGLSDVVSACIFGAVGFLIGAVTTVLITDEDRTEEWLEELGSTVASAFTDD